MESNPTFPIPLGSQAWAAGSPLTFDFRALPAIKGLAIPHVMSVDIEVDLDPTYTTPPTVFGHNNVIMNVSIFDGLREWYPMGGSLNVVRTFERLENGKVYIPETILGNGSTNNRWMRRRHVWAPPKQYGSPADGAFNAAYLQAGGGKVVLTCGQLADIGADVTAATGVVKVTANCSRFYNKVLFPAYHPRRMNALDNGKVISQRALYATFGLLNSTSFDSFAAGDVGAITIDCNGDLWVINADSQAITSAFNADMVGGQIDAIMGDPRNATYDVNGRRINLTTPTALEAQAPDLQAVMYVAPDTRLSKLFYTPEKIILSVTGTNVGTQQVIGRYEPMTAQERGTQLVTAIDNLGGRTVVPGEEGFNLRLADDALQLKGPLRDFYPWQAKLKAA